MLSFCSDEAYTHTQASFLLDTHKSLFNSYIIGSKDKTGGSERDDAIALFKDRIKHACADGMFNVSACAKIATYFANVFVRNFDAYQYALSNLPVEMVQFKLLCVQTPLLLPPMAAATAAGQPFSPNSSVA